MDSCRIEELKAIARNVRLGILEETYNAGSGHPGGSLSCTDILTYLYFEEMKVRPEEPKWVDRDRFVLSKGHAAPALYASCRKRLFSERAVKNPAKNRQYAAGAPGYEQDARSGYFHRFLRHRGYPRPAGMALAARLDRKDLRVYTITGDGELEEGQIWEAAMFASHYSLDNLYAFVDANGLQIDGKTTEVLSPEPIDKRFEAFGWFVQRINGHDFAAIHDALEKAKTVKGQPHVIICDTVKGKGVSFMENKAGWHGVAPKKEEYEQAVSELTAKDGRESNHV